MPRNVAAARDYLRLIARLLWQPGLQRRLDLSDAVQQTLLEAHRSLDQFGGTTPQEWQSWLRTILKRVLWKAARDIPPGEVSLNRSAGRLEDVITDDQSSPSEHVQHGEEQEALKQRIERLATALGELSEKERTAVELKYLHSCSVKFIAQHMNRTEYAVGGLLKRGMRKLRNRLRDYEREE
jgi:RNA polymerase sigma-70 factor (ECF subfamily)